MRSFAVPLGLLLVFLVQIFATQVRYDGFRVYRVTPKTEEALKFLQNIETRPNGYRFWDEFNNSIGKPTDVMVPPHLRQEFSDIVKTGFSSQLLILNVQKLIDRSKPKSVVEAGEFDWTDYHTLDEINSWLASLAQEFPDKVTLLVGGRSYEGRDIQGVRVSFGPGNENRTVFLESNIHACEWISSAVSTYILNEILRSPNPDIRTLAEGHDWYVFPIFNPDGFEYSHTTDRLWRKTRVPYGECYGADPNRNWDYHYNEGGAENFSCSLYYNGPNAFSEPCAKSLSEFISTIGHTFMAYIGFHSYAQELLIPYGYTADHLDNYDELYEIGLLGLISLAQRYGTVFGIGNVPEELYIASGGSIDWVKGTFKTPLTYTYELRDKGDFGFLLPPEQIIPTALEVLDSLITIFDEFEARRA